MQYTINYKLLAESGVIIDEADNFNFKTGDGTFASELENCIQESKINKIQTFLLNGSDIFGAYDESAKQFINLTELPKNIKKGSAIDFGLPSGDKLLGSVIEIDKKNDKALVDFNHPLSAINISFIVTVLEKK